MTLEILHTTPSASRLILIFAGWSTSAPLYLHIRVEGWDVALVSGDDLTAPDWEPLRHYSTIYLYAWSMGVYFAMRLLPEFIKPVACYAINGTPTPCHDTQGIPRATFLATADTLTERTLEKFRIRMCGSVTAYRALSEQLQGGDPKRLAEQLQRVATDTAPLRSLPWRAAYISTDDRIFPPTNQRRAWEGIAEIRTIEGAHYTDPARIVRHTAINTTRVGTRFTRSLDTYTQHAHAQRTIAERLAERLASMLPDRHVGTLIEIGSGTGLFTYAWSRLVSADKAHFLDLCPMPKYKVSAQELYTQGDAEQAVAEMAEQAPGSVDAIVSASSIQWFVNPEKFLADCLRLLRPGGVLAISTFAPGNLPELHAMRTDPMHYPSPEQLRRYMHAYADVSVSQEDVEIDFTTPIDALRHLRLTGVTGSGATAGIVGVRRFAAAYPVNARGRYSLTFKPLYLLGRRSFSRLETNT